MKESQWVIAAVLLAALVFVVVFASQYLGTGTRGPDVGEAPTFRKLTLLNETFDEREPEKAPPPLVVEEGTKGWHDFYMLNNNEEAVQVGLDRPSCQCSGVDLFVLEGDGKEWLKGQAVLLFSAGASSPLPLLGAHLGTRGLMEQQAKKYEMKVKIEKVEVKPGALCWASLHFHATEPAPLKKLTAPLWFDDPSAGRIVLGTRVTSLPAFTVRERMYLPDIKEGDLAGEGVTYSINVWSPTRSTFDVRAERVSARVDSDTDPFTVGSPVRLTAEELAAAVRDPAETDQATQSLGGYRIPITFKAVSADGKVPMELGPFVRRVKVICPGLPKGDAGKVVLLQGRVRGLIEIGDGTPGSGEVRLGSFPREDGAFAYLNLSTRKEGVKIEPDKVKTSKFLRAEVLGPPKVSRDSKGTPTRWEWRVKVRVPGGEADGDFPRRGKKYEDSAVYFRATQRGSEKVASVRVAVSGAATE